MSLELSPRVLILVASTFQYLVIVDFRLPCTFGHNNNTYFSLHGKAPLTVNNRGTTLWARIT
jgi:hypothetical protein